MSLEDDNDSDHESEEPQRPTPDDDAVLGMDQPDGGPGGIGNELGRKRPYDHREQEAFLNILRTASHIKRPFDRLFRAHDISHTLYNVLRIIAGHAPKGVTRQVIGQQLISQMPDVTRLIISLHRQGLVYEVDCTDDARRSFLHLTDAGTDRLAVLDPLVVDLHSRQLGHIEAKDLQRLCALLDRCRMT